MHFRYAIAASLLGLVSACTTAGLPSGDPSPNIAPQRAGNANCAAATFPDDRLISASFTDRYNGRYWYGTQALDVWREGQRMFVGTREGERRQIRKSPEVAGESVFSDGCRTHYYFNLAPDGHGALLQIVEMNGVQRAWERR